MKNTFHKMMSLLLVFSMCFSVLVMGGQAVQANATISFDDVSTDHWALKHIVKMELQGIVTGYGGSFRPEDSVKQVEALTMAVRVLGLDDEAKQISDSRTLPFDNVPSWAKGYVAVGLDEGLIKESEEFKATKGATRAWVAKLMVRTIGKEQEAISLADEMTGFTDHYVIPYLYRGYVKAAVKYNLVSGYTDGSFQPNKVVKRGEMTKLLSVSQGYLGVERENVDHGQFVRVNGSMITLQQGEQEKSFIVNNNTMIFDDKKQVSLEELPLDSELMIISHLGTAQLIDVMAVPATDDNDSNTGDDQGDNSGSDNGTGDDNGTQTDDGDEKTAVLDINLDRSILIVESGQQLETLVMDSQVEYKNEHGVVLAGLSALSIGDEVEITRDTDGNVTAVTVLGMSENAETEGVIISVNETSQLMTIEMDNGTPVSYRYSDQVVVEYAGYRFPTVSDLASGDKVTLEVQAGYITHIVVQQTDAQGTVEGKVVSLSADTGYITLETDLGLKAYRVGENADIFIEGLDIARLTDIAIDDQVEIEVQDAQIVSLNVLNRSVETQVQGKVVAVDSTNQLVIYEDDNGENHVKNVSPYAQFVINNVSNPTLADLQVGSEIIMQLEQDEIVLLSTNNYHTGVVDAISENSRLIQLTEEDGRESYVLGGQVSVSIEGVDNEQLDDVEEGDTVRITVSSGLVTDIDVQRKMIFEVQEVSSTRQRLETEDKNGNDENLYIRGLVDLVVPGKTDPAITDVSEGDIVRATYLGNILKKVEVLPRVKGEVTAVNIAQGEITVQDYTGQEHVIVLGDTPEIDIDGNIYNNLNAIAIHDRVEVRETLTEDRQVTVMRKISGTFLITDSDLEKIYLKTDGGTSFEDYRLMDTVYVHSGDQVLTLRNLVEDDEVDIYLLNRHVYEVERMD